MTTIITPEKMLFERLRDCGECNDDAHMLEFLQKLNETIAHAYESGKVQRLFFSSNSFPAILEYLRYHGCKVNQLGIQGWEISIDSPTGCP